MKHKEHKPRITIKKNGEVVTPKTWEIPLDLAEKIKEKAKNEGLSEVFLVRKMLMYMVLQEPVKKL